MTVFYKRPLLLLLVFSAIASVHVFVDRPLALTLHQFHDTPLHQVFYVITWAGWGAPWYAFLACLTALCFVMSRFFAESDAGELWHRRFCQSGFVFSSLVGSGTVVMALKHLLGRYRPERLFEDGLYGFAPFSGNTSFPSGHTQTICAIMSALWFVYPRYRALWVSIAACISLSRVIITQHYMSDVLTSAFLAIMGTLIVSAIFARRGWSSFPLH